MLNLKTQTQVVEIALALVLSAITWRLTQSGTLKLTGGARVAAAVGVGALSWYAMRLYGASQIEEILQDLEGDKTKAGGGGADKNISLPLSKPCGDTCLGACY